MFKKVVLGLVAFLVSVAFAMPVAASQIIRIDGSSTVYPITEGVTEEFLKAHRDVMATVGISGTGGGFRKFCRGETDVQNASRPIRGKELDACKAAGIEFIELLIAYDGLAVMVNPKNDWVKHLTMEDLKKIWEPVAEGLVTRWDHVRAEFPKRPLKLYGPGTDSGTFDFFTEEVVGKARASRADFVASEDDHILARGIAGDVNALGYFGMAYYEALKDRLKLVPIVSPKTGKPVAPSMKTVMDGTYPLARPLFIYVNRKSLDRPEVARFVEFYLKNVAKIAKEVKYVPLTAEELRRTEERFTRRITGTAPR